MLLWSEGFHWTPKGNNKAIKLRNPLKHRVGHYNTQKHVFVGHEDMTEIGNMCQNDLSKIELIAERGQEVTQSCCGFTEAVDWHGAEEWHVIIMMMDTRDCFRGKRQKYVCLGKRGRGWSERRNLSQSQIFSFSFKMLQTVQWESDEVP